MIFEYIKTNALKCFRVLASSSIVLSSEDECVRLSRVDDDEITIIQEPDLFSNHDEGDTKVILHAYSILNADADALVTICSQVILIL